MGDVAIRAENLSKLYRIGEHQGGYKTLRETIVRPFSSLFRKQCHNPQSTIRNPESEFIWALKDISFEVKSGEVVGIIGRNGAGKTTLLKILSRITEPTEGWAEIRGRVGSLLEVGTGFHPELTGRENIYLNGAILGMKKAELNRKFDEIVDFAELEKFIDTPVKRYSSGMYVRLAFAVAAHLEPEILLVDEVLAVGDAAFQKKCLGKMGEVAGEGRTVFFVSHNMGAIEKLCDSALWLADGKIKIRDETRGVVNRYLAATISHAKSDSLRRTRRRQGNGRIRLTDFHLEDDRGRIIQCIHTGQACRFVFEFSANSQRPLRNVAFAFGLRDSFDSRLTRLSSEDQGLVFQSVPSNGVFCCDIDRFPLSVGEYIIGATVTVNGEVSDVIVEAATVRVEAGDFYGKGRLTTDGPVFVPHSWSVQDGSR